MHFLNVFGNVAVCCIFAVCGVSVNLSAIFEIRKKRCNKSYKRPMFRILSVQTNAVEAGIGHF